MAGSIEKARVSGDADVEAPTLFSMGDYSRPAVSPEALCARIGLNWLSALELHALGWLSFDPKTTPRLSAAQEAEILFLGTLVAAGCDTSLLRHLLARLPKPYAYRMDRVFYDWSTHSWRLFEEAEDIEERFDGWLQEMIGWKEMGRLERLRDRLDGAIGYLRSRAEAS
jgi:hypothetical protein